MSLIIDKFDSLDSSSQQEIAGLISSYTTGGMGEKPQMLAVSPVAILEKHIGFVALQEGNFAGFVGAKKPEDWNGNLMSEVGSLWVPEGFRERGIAHKLVEVISNELTELGKLPYAFCNPLSLPIFSSLGYKPAIAKEMPAHVYDACVDCPMKPSRGCCDTALIFKGGN